MEQPLWEKFWEILVKISTHLTYDIANPKMREIRDYVHIKICSWMFLVALILIAKN